MFRGLQRHPLPKRNVGQVSVGHIRANYLLDTFVIMDKSGGDILKKKKVGPSLKELQCDNMKTIGMCSNSCSYYTL